MEKIVICESCCQGFEHADFNAALLLTVHLAFPGATLDFFSDGGHGKLVAERLGEAVGDVPITYGAIAAPERGASSIRQFATQSKSSWRALSQVRSRSSRAAVFSCVTGPALLALKTILWLLGPLTRTVGVAHGALAGLQTLPSRAIWKGAFSMRRALEMPHPAGLKLVALGESIYHEVTRILPTQRLVWRSLDLPCLWPKDLRVSPSVGLQDSIRFGFLGASCKGFDLFCEIAQSISAQCPGSEFAMVGFLGKGTLPPQARRFVTGMTLEPLAPAAYRSRLEGLTYCLWLGDPRHYQLTASATFVDTLAYGKPCIALRNPYLEHYYGKMGDIGYLCNGADELLSTVRSILRGRPAERYARQVANLFRGRTIFEPSQLAGKLRQIVEGTPDQESIPSAKKNAESNLASRRERENQGRRWIPTAGG